MSVVTADDGMKRYKKLEKLGEGTYGLVYKAIDLEKDRFVAIKRIKLDNNEEGIPATTMREVSLLSHLKHKNIISMDGCLYINGELYLVFDYMSCDLKGYIDKLSPNKYLSKYDLKKFTYYLVEGIRFCHSRRILHRDLKPQNILISDDVDKELKIADFGLGREHGLPINTLTHEVVTLWYRPPEILLGKKQYSGACDVWGIGCIMAEMATKVPLFAGDSEIDQIFQIYKILGTPNENIWPGISKLPQYKAIGPKWRKKDLSKELNQKLDSDGIHLLKQTLIYAPNKRITAKEMLIHKWFDQIRDEMINEFGNIYPHCGSKQYQLERFNQEKEKRKLKKKKQNLDKKNKTKRKNNKDKENIRKRRRINNNQENKPNLKKNKNYKMNQDHINDDTDYDDDDDDDITGNGEECGQENKKGKKNLSQPMDEDEHE